MSKNKKSAIKKETNNISNKSDIEKLKSFALEEMQEENDNNEIELEEIRNNNKKEDLSVFDNNNEDYSLEEQEKDYDSINKTIEEEKKQEEKNLKQSESRLSLVSFLVAVIIVGIIIVLMHNSVYKKPQDDNEFKENLSSESIEKIGQESFNSINSIEQVLSNNKMFFTSNNVDINNLNDEEVLYFAYQKMSDEDKNRKGEVADSCYLDDMDNDISKYPSNCLVEEFSTNVLKEQIDNHLYNKTNINYVNFRISSNMTCYLDNSTYHCYLNKSDYNINSYNTITKFNSVKEENDKLYVTSYLLTIRTTDYKEFEKGIYSDSNALNKIDDITYFERDLNSSIDSENNAKLVNKYQDKITKYKSTFVKKGNRYLWESTIIEK